MKMKIKQSYFRNIRLVFVGILLSTCTVFSQEEETFYPAPIITKDKKLRSSISKQYVAGTENIDRELSDYKKATIREKMSKRKESLYEMLEEGKLILEGDLYDYVQGIANKLSTENNKVYLVRSGSSDAYNFGDNNLFIHVGLLQWLSNEAELAYVIGHLLGHNDNDHFEKKMIAFSKLRENDLIRELEEKIEGKEYCHVSSLRRLLVPWILAGEEVSMTLENQADSAAFVKMDDAGYDIAKASPVFDLLDHDHSKADAKPIDISNLLGLEDIKSNFTAALNFKFSEGHQGGDKHNLRLHPFASKRKDLLKDEIDSDAQHIINASFLKYQIFARKEVIVNAIREGNLERAIYHLLQVHDEDSTDLFSRKLIPFCFASLALEKKRSDGESEDEKKHQHSNDNYSKVTHFLRTLKTEQCIKITELWNANVEMELEKYLRNANEAVLSLIKEDKETFDLQLMREHDPRYYYLVDVLKGMAKKKKR